MDEYFSSTNNYFGQTMKHSSIEVIQLTCYWDICFLGSFLHRFVLTLGNEAQGRTTENKGSLERARKELRPWQILNLNFLSKKTKCYHKWDP